jgi:antitoxin (DNA-binding transcriptional repressor) of toxin-antitoxin stability system
MCYMKTYGVRELRQNATGVLREVAEGETVIITSNGRPIAQMIAPVNDPWSALIASGEVTPARTSPRAILSLPPQPYTPASGHLADMRRGER